MRTEAREIPFNPKTQLNDAFIESYGAEKKTLDNILEGDRGLPEISCMGESCIFNR